MDGDLSEELIREFMEDEVRQAIWECDSFKSLKTDKVNFGFVKELLEDIKSDITRVMEKFPINS